MATYLLVDTMNTFFRARHVVRGDMNTKIGMSYHIMFNSINKVFREQKGTHVVLCLEGRSWRKNAYEPYKNNRKVARAALTEAEQEEAFSPSNASQNARSSSCRARRRSCILGCV